MADCNACQVHQASEHLVAVEFDEGLGNRAFAIVLSDYRICRFREVVHNHIQILIVLLGSEECVFHFEYIGMVEFFEYLVFPVLILRILQDLLDGNNFQCLLISPLHHNKKTL